MVDGGIKAARNLLATEHAKRLTGEHVAASPRLTFNVAADVWWSTRAIRLRPATQRIHRYHLDRLRERFGRTRLTAITPADIAAYLALQEAAGAAGWTLRGRLTVLSAVFTYAGRHLGHPGGNPIRLLDRVERPNVEDETPKRILTDDELAALLDVTDKPHRLLYETIAQTGMRKSDAAGLTWRNVDLDAMTITVDGQLDRRTAGRVQTKTRRSVRTLVITPALAAKLRAHRLATGRPAAHDLVFRRPSGKPYNLSSVDGLMRTSRKRAGLDAIEHDGIVVARAPTPHDLRHTHASRLIAAGWDIAEIAARLGDSIETVLSVYAHEFDAARRREAQRDRLADLYGSAMEAPERSKPQQTGRASIGEVGDLQAKRSKAQ